MFSFLVSGLTPRRGFFRVLTTFLWLNTILPAVHNRILMRHGYVWLDLLISARYVVVVPLVHTAQGRSAKTPHPGFIRAIRSGNPIFLAVALVAVAFMTARSHFYIGLAAALFAVIAYGTLYIVVQSGGLENEDFLMASNAAPERRVEMDGLTAIPSRRAFNERLDREIAEILPATDGAGAMVAAEKARKRVAELGLRHPAAAAGFVTVSIGASIYDGLASCLPQI